MKRKNDYFYHYTFQYMRKITHFFILFSILTSYVSVFSQNNSTWSSVTMQQRNISISKEKNIPSFKLNIQNLASQLKNAPKKSNQFLNKTAGVIVDFPSGKDSFTSYRITENNVLSDKLAEKYPTIKSYRGVSVKNPLEKIYFSMDETSFHGMIRNHKKTYYINPSEEKNDLYYFVEKTAVKAFGFECKVEGALKTSTSKKDTQYSLKPVDDSQLRTYRLALACTAEYAKFHTDRAGVTNGTEAQKKAAVLSAMNTSVTRINSIYENDLAINLQLIDNNDALIFLDAATDGLTNGDGQALIDEIQDVIDLKVGFANYDIGHVFSTSPGGGDGIAQLASVCTTNKARGVTGYVSPVGDAYDVDFVAHEIGHQFGATHTFNNSCNSNRSGATSVEPGSGSTIMAYAGICPSNVQGNSDAYFHAISISQIWDNITQGTGTCATTTPINNTAPVISPLTNYTIPAGTPFVLDAAVTDGDNDVLTYSWEQQNNEISVQPPLADADEGPSFRSLPPSLSSKRYFPEESALLNNNLAATWEVIPTVSRTLNFSLLVRDNNTNGGQTARSDLSVSTVKTSTPFAVTSQTTPETLQGGSVYKVIWNVGETNKIPISTSFVDIYLILNNDFENPIPLSENTKNDGVKQVVIPGDITTSNARIMVKASNNIYFALNEATLSIEASNYALIFETLEYNICKPNSLSIPFTYNSYGTFAETVTFSATNLPTGLTVNFNETETSVNGTLIEATITNTDNLVVGINDFTIVATAESGETKEYPVELSIFEDSYDAINLIAPVNQATEIPLQTVLSWDEYSNANSYNLQVSKTSDFSSIIVSETLTATQYQPTNLEETTTYYWRIKPINACGEGSFGAAFSFSTVNISCGDYTNNSTYYISNSGSSTTVSNLNIVDNGILNDITVTLDISHTWLEDLTISLISPSGTVITLLSQQCGERDNIAASFNDSGSIVTCSASVPTLSGTIKPQQQLQALNGEPIKGIWKLKVDDANDEDGGSINSFKIDLCINGDFDLDTDKDGVLDSEDNCPNTPMGAKVDVNGCEIFNLPINNYQIKLTDESCINSNNGNISIEATQNYNYTATLTGNGVDTSNTFKTTTEFTNLSSGTYKLCFTTDASTSYKQCYEVNINEPLPLSVFSRRNSTENKISLDLSGSDLFTIELNGEISKTNRSSIELSLNKGINRLKVYTDKECQGLYEELIISTGDIAVFPNPFTTEATIYTPSPNTKTEINIFNITGKLATAITKNSDANGQVKLNLSQLTTGMYMLNVTNGKNIKTLKILKE